MHNLNVISPQLITLNAGELLDTNRKIAILSCQPNVNVPNAFKLFLCIFTRASWIGRLTDTNTTIKRLNIKGTSGKAKEFFLGISDIVIEEVIGKKDLQFSLHVTGANSWWLIVALYIFLLYYCPLLFFLGWSSWMSAEE